MVKCPNCDCISKDNSTLLAHENHYDHSFVSVKCNCCQKEYAIELDVNNNIVGTQIQREDGKIYCYDLQGKLFWVV